MNKLFKNLFNKKYMRGGSKNQSLNIVILIVVILLFVYIYRQNKNQPVIQIALPTQNTQPTQPIQPTQPTQSAQKQDTNIQTKTKTKINTIHPKYKQFNRIKKPQVGVPPLDPDIIIPEIYDVLRDYDYRTLNDSLTPPYKRDDDMIPANVIAPDLFGIYTQGGPYPFIKMGKLVDNKSKNDDPYKFLILFGRKRYSGSNLYDYYATTTNRDDYLKFDLDRKNTRYELFTGNHVYIPELKKKYEVIIDRVMDFTYTPYM
jgi:hypothetical protein